MAKESVWTYESPEVLGAYSCEHTEINGSTQPGDDVVCLDCLELLDAGAQIVRFPSPAMAEK